MVYGLKQPMTIKYIGSKYFNGKKFFVIFDSTNKEVIEKYKKELIAQGNYVRVEKYIDKDTGKIRYTLYRRKKN